MTALIEPLEVRRLLASVVESVFHAGDIPQAHSTRFSDDLSASISLDAFAVDALSGNPPLLRSGMSLNWDATALTANVQLTTNHAGILDNGWYDAIWSQVALPLDAEHRHAFRWVLGDLNNNGAVSNQDISPFIDAVIFGVQMPNPLTAPGQIESWALSSTSTRINWTPPTLAGGTPDGYRIYRSTDGTNFTQVAELEDPKGGRGGFFWDDTGLEHGTKYWYRIRPFFDDPVHGRMNGHTTEKVWSVTVLPAPEQLQAEHVWAQAIALAWSDAASGEEGYTLERALTSDFADAATFTLPAGSQSFVDIGLQPQTQYWYRVRAEKGAAPSAWVPLSVQTLPLSSTLTAPGALQVAAATTTSLALGWTDQAIGETHYVLLRSDRSDFASGSVERFILGADAESFLDTGLVAGTGYWYRLFAASGTEASPIVELEAATVLPAPTSLAFQGQSFVDGVSFTWTDLADNEDYYLVEWSADGSEWFVIDELPANATTYTDEFPVIGIDNHYRLRAGRAGESIVESQPSNEAARRPIAPGVAWYDDNAGANERGTLSPHAVAHNDTDGLTFSVLPNDVDYDAGVLSIPPDGFTQPPHGELTLHPVTGEFTYVPNGQFVGTDTFTYWVTDVEALSAPATVAIDVTNEVPVANGLQNPQWHESLVSNQLPLLSFTGTVTGADADQDAITFGTAQLPAHGSLALNPQTGEFTYQPHASFNGHDSFIYFVKDTVDARSHPYRVVIDRDAELAVSGYAIRIAPGTTLPTSPAFPPTALTQPGAAFVVSADDLPVHGQLHTVWTEQDGGWLVVRSATLQPGVVYNVDDGPGGYLFYVPNAGVTGVVDDIAITYHRNNREITKPQHILLHVTNDEVIGTRPQFAAFGLDIADGAGERTLVSNLRLWLSITDPNVSIDVEITQDPLHGQARFDDENARILYTPQVDDGASLGWDCFQLRITVGDQPPLLQWVQIDPGYVTPPLRLVTTAPASDWVQASDWAPAASTWTPISFDGSLVAVHSKLTLVQAKRTAVVRELAALGGAWQSIHDEVGSDEEVLGHFDEASSALDGVKSAYLTYLDGWLELHADATSYQNGWQAYWDNYWDPETYGMVQAGIQSLPIDIAGIKPTVDYHAKIAAALQAYGDAAGFQSNLAGTVFTIAEQSHQVLERTEQTLGLLSGGTYSAASITTKAGLVALFKTVARNYVIEQLAQPLVTPAMSGVIAMAVQAGVSPTLVRAGMLAMQATGLGKAAKGRVTSSPQRWSWNLSGKQKLSKTTMTRVTWTKVDDATYDAITGEFYSTRRRAFLLIFEKPT